MTESIFKMRNMRSPYCARWTSPGRAPVPPLLHFPFSCVLCQEPVEPLQDVCFPQDLVAEQDAEIVPHSEVAGSVHWNSV